jgi:phosphopantothenoylcysteine decarboxylase/phosphopantothenate--cysteine ligase
VDPVRFVGNRSSGRMGRALAEAAWRRGADVTLITGPVALEPPAGTEVVRVETALQMRDAVARRIGEADVVLFAAAVADFRPEDERTTKMKRSETGGALDVHLVANPDVAAETRSARKPGAVVVGFALETDGLVENARKKLTAKGFDLVVANPAGVPGAGFESETNQVTLIGPQGDPEALPLMDKDAVADAVLDRVEALLAGR